MPEFDPVPMPSRSPASLSLPVPLPPLFLLFSKQHTQSETVKTSNSFAQQVYLIAKEFFDEVTQVFLPLSSFVTSSLINRIG